MARSALPVAARARTQADHRGRRQRVRHVLIERAEERQRSVIGVGLFIGNGEVRLSDVIACLHGECAFEFWDGERRLAELHQD